MEHTILLVDDDPQFAHSLDSLLSANNFSTDVCYCPFVAMDKLQSRSFDVVLLDLEFLKGSGFEVLNYLRLTQVDSLIIVISQTDSYSDRVKALKAGADEFIAKPFYPQELLIRIEKLICRCYGCRNQKLSTNYFDIDLLSGQITLPHKSVYLRRKEFDILTYLIKKKNEVVSKEILVERLWSIEETPQYATIDVHIRRIRLSIGDKQKQIIRTVYGKGYMFWDEGRK